MHTRNFMGCGCHSKLADHLDLVKPGFSDKYTLQNIISSGSFARVFQVKAKSIPYRTRVAKIMEDSDEDSDYWSTRNIYIREASILKKMLHPNIVRVFDCFAENALLYLVLEHLPGGELFQHVVTRGRLEEKLVKHVTEEILSAIKYLHEKQIIFRDVKADNFVFADKRCTSIKMIDFGLAIEVQPSDIPLEETCGSPHYLAPELIGQSYGFPVDLWALGILVFLLLHGQYPFNAPSTQELVEHILTGSVEARLGDHVSELGKKFLIGLCESDEGKRLSAKTALEHPWIRTKKWRKTITDPTLVREQSASDMSPRTFKARRQMSLN